MNDNINSSTKSYSILCSRVNAIGYSGNNINSDPNSNTISISGNANFITTNNTNNNTNTNTHTSTPLMSNKKSINSSISNKNVNNNGTEITTYDYDICLDKIIMYNSNETKQLQELIFEQNTLASQQDVWDKIGSALREKWEDRQKSVTLMTVGGNHSGKSYSLFGSTIGNDEKGIVPRFIESLFRANSKEKVGWNAKYVMMSCCLVHEEEIYDLLDPPKCYSYSGSLATTSNDVIILPLSSPIFSSSESLEEIFRLSLQSLAVLLSNSIDFFHNHHTIIKFQVFGDNGMQTVTFVELGSISCPSNIPTAVDRFNGKSYTYRSMRAFKNCLKKLPTLPLLSAKKKLLASSVLTYLLQTDVFLEPNLICLNCIRGYEGSYNDDSMAMSLAKDIKAFVTSTESSIQFMQPYNSLIKNIEIDIKETVSYLYNALLEEEVKAPGTSGIYGQTNAKTNINPKGMVTKVKPNNNAMKANNIPREMDKYPGGKHDDIPTGYYYRNKFSYLHNYHFLLESIDKNISSNINSFPYALTKTQLIFEEPPLVKKPTRRKKQKAEDEIIPPYTLKQPNQDLEPLDSKLHQWLFSMGLLLPGYSLPKLETAKAKELSEIEAIQAEIKKLQDKKENDGVSIASAEHIPQLGWAYDSHFHSYGYLTMICPTEISNEFSRVLLIPKGQTFIRGSQIQLKKISIPYNLIEDHKVNPYITMSPENLEREVQLYKREEAFFCTSMGYHVGDVTGTGTPPTSPQDNEGSKFDRLLNRPDIRVVRIHGPEMEPLHCKIREEHGNLYLSPERLESGLIAKVGVNGRIIENEISLRDGDIIKIGLSRFLRVNIPFQRNLNSPIRDQDVSRSTPLSRSPSQNIAMTPTPLSRSPSYNPAVSPLLSRSPSHNNAAVARSPSNNSKTGTNLHAFFPESDPRYFLTAWELSMLLSFESWLKDIVYSFEKNRRTVTHLDVNRPLVEASKRLTRTPEMNMKSFDPTDEDVESILACIPIMDKVFICELVGACLVCNTWSHQMRRGVTFDVNLRPFNPSDTNNRGKVINIPVEALDLSLPPTEDLLINIAIFGNSPSENGRYWLSTGMLCERMGLMKEMWESWAGPWCLQDGMWLDKIYNRALDAFQDNYDDDLIGVGFVYLDSLQYLLDINDNIPIIDINGNQSGNIKLRIRSWIDKIETLPAYLAVDKETHLSNFLDKKLIICFYFDGLQNLPEKLCSSTYVYFKFFYHRVGFKTIRHSGENVNPILGNIVRVDQRITKDFIQFLRTASLEMEVFGKKKPLLKLDDKDALLLGSPHDNEIFKNLEKLEKQKNKDLGLVEATVDDKVGQDNIDALTDKLNETLDQLDDANYQITTLTKQLEDKVEKSADNELFNKQKMENKKLNKRLKELEDELAKAKTVMVKDGTVVNKGKGSEACSIS